MTGIWFLDDMARVARERQEIQSLLEAVGWVRDPTWRLTDAGLALDATICVHDRDFPLRMTYPAHFPSVPPSVRPQREDERWSGHQYSDGTLCLEWGPDTWRPDVTGRHMLESAHRLLDVEQDDTPDSSHTVPSRHELAAGQAVRSQPVRAYLPEGVVRHLRAVGVDAGRVFFSYHRQSQSHLLVVQRVELPGNDWVDPDVPETLRRERESTLVEPAMLVRLNVPSSTVQSVSTVSAFDDLLRQQGHTTLTDAQAGLGAVNPLSALVLDADDNPHFLVRFRPDSPDLYAAAVVRSPIPTGVRLPPDLAALSSKSVGIVGLGSVGSKVALSLARSGVGRFVLLDHDLFLPENVVRNALDLHNTAELKVDAVAQLLKRVAPGVVVEVSRMHLTGQESNEAVARALRKIAGCDLVIDATANPRVFNVAAAVAQSGGRPLIWMEVFGGGLGGMVARSRPNRDATAHVIRDVYHGYTRDHPREEPPATADYTVIAAAGAAITAADAHVGVIADHATLLVLDALTEREPSQYPHSLYLIGLQRGWVFEAPFHTIAVETPPAGKRADDPGPKASDGAVLDFVLALLKEKNGPTAAPS